MQGEAMTAQAVAAVIIQLRGDEVQLDVGTRIRGQMSARERACLGDVGDDRNPQCMQVVRRPDTREHVKVWARDRAGGKNHFTLGACNVSDTDDDVVVRTLTHSHPGRARRGR